MKLKLKCEYYCRLRTVKENIYKTRLVRKLKKIPGILQAVRLIRKSLSKKASYETSEFFIVIEDIYNTEYMSATITPKSKEISLESLNEIFKKLEGQALEKRRVFLPRIILDSTAPESLKESLREAGIRIMNE